MTKAIDINSDMGESFGVYTYGRDEAIIRSVSSANLACGFHAGDPTVMRRSVVLARDAQVAIGAHFGFRDLSGFGRRRLHVKPGDLKNDVSYQLGALAALVKAENARLHHVKAHGALYMMALEDDELSRAIVEAVLEFDDSLMIYTIGASATEQMARGKGLRVIREFFADRPYLGDGQVKMFDWSLEEIGATAEAIGQRIRRLVTEGVVLSTDDTELTPAFETICIHSDTPGSAKIACEVRHALQTAPVRIEAP